ncbi:glycine cleavage system protein GcvH [Hoeflea prorocentri]|uniref:Glycine cleavage system H protein n=1 Tax=Hoeflea prorocentri TaxID=1922333 RepID=A0A9X3UHU0_9HYPH|nr:glycine cleavage system protein GcvH [Hoeflea prorocentri]MCY6380932.1 glycine cleavage system protein GcvH [Hoeflea prorocentri]MDA5398732.1 glycine cleavage system protein GcvH [Hoeflea prorocentri]
MGTTFYTEDHEWIRVDGDQAVVGITNYAQEQLGDIVFVELPEAGRKVAKAETVIVVESVKAASDVYSPVGGEVLAVNDKLEAEPGLINEAAESDGWLMKLRLDDKAELEGLMDKAAYDATTG